MTQSASLDYRRRLWRLTYFIGPDLLFLALFLALLLALTAAYGGRRASLWHGSLVLPASVMIILCGTAFVPRLPAMLRGSAAARRAFAEKGLATLRDWFPLVLIVLVYENFHDLTDVIHPEVVDGTLRRLDEALLGIAPARALLPITRPWLTELMSLAYLLYFVYPTLILTTFYSRGEFVRFREFGLALSLAFYLGLFGYMLVPAVGPRYTMAAELPVTLDGIWLTEPAARAWDSIESVKRDCFPSLHTALTTISLVYFWRYRRAWRGGRALFAVCAPLIVLLWASTLYLRYHYFVDVLAGWSLALFCAGAAPRLVRWYYAQIPLR
jgi:membrane-associated phospholipid phosphatase